MTAYAASEVVSLSSPARVIPAENSIDDIGIMKRKGNE